MSDWEAFLRSRAQEVEEYSGKTRVVRFGAVEEEYRALDGGAGLVARTDRALFEVRGEDRASWLHNLTTNQIKPLGAGEGNYAFALDIKGRILFDTNVVVRSDSIWIDLDRLFLDRALAHFEKYVVVEDVTLEDRSETFVRLALTGSGAGKVLDGLGATNALAMPALGLSSIRWRETEIPLIRHDFCGPFGVELLVPQASAVSFWEFLTGEIESPRVTPVGAEAVRIRRIEAGIPWPGGEITDDVLPAETLQSERAVSYQKGCYLGQEIVERMRSRGQLARKLVGLVIEGEDVPDKGAELRDPGEKAVGRLTSCCPSIAKGTLIGLGYVKTDAGETGARLKVAWDDRIAEAEVSLLPFVASPIE